MVDLDLYTPREALLNIHEPEYKPNCITSVIKTSVSCIKKILCILPKNTGDIPT
jgi:hypothetical protein